MYKGIFVVRLALPLGVAQMHDLRRHGDDGAVLPQQQAVGEQQIVGPGRRGLEEAVAVLVFEDADAVRPVFAFGRAVGIIAHLDDPEPAVGVESHGDGAFDLRLGGDQFDAQARGQPKVLEWPAAA